MKLVLRNPSKKKLTKSQSAFNRLIKKIESLQNLIQETDNALTQGLRYYHSNVHPLEENMLVKLTECIPIFYSYYKNPRSKLSKKEREILKELIQSLLSRLTEYVLPHQISREISDIFSDFEGRNFHEKANSEFASLKNDIASFAAESGLKIDLSDFNITDSEEELMAKFGKAMHDASQNEREERASKDTGEKIKKKTKQQLKKEQDIREVEEVQKKSLSKIYKQLAKALHPDLEQDPLIKVEKEVLMKKLTTAYENHDLHALLSLEITWMNRSVSNKSESYLENVEDQLKIYNAILKDQVESLQFEFNCLHHHPKYYVLQRILNTSHPSYIFSVLEDEETQLSLDIERYSSAIIDLKEGSNFKRIKEILKEFSGTDQDVFNHMISLLTK